MNVFIIPSWYPHRCFPWEGKFLEGQARAIAELRPEWNVAISTWAQGEGFVSSAHVLKSPRCVIDALLARPGERELLANLVELRHPVLAWPVRVLGGNRGGILAANRANLDRAIARFGRIDVLHAHVSYPAGWVAMQLARERGIPYVITEHMGPFPLPVYARTDGTLEPYLREPLLAANARIAVSPMLAERIASFGIPAPEYIPNLIDEREYSPGPPAKRDSFTFYTLCLMDPTKGVADLLQAAALFLRRLPDASRDRVRFRLGGDGPALGQFKALATQLGIDRTVEWLGQMPRERAREEFQRCDCFVLPSHHESFGIVYVEAHACGKPVIATRCGGPEVIVTAENGVLVDVRDVPRLADALHFMFENARGYDAAVIRAQCLERFGRAAVVDRLEAVYRRIAHSPGAPAPGAASAARS
jgi:glycosyltransferase involved in cell wall biosynthesis